MVVFCLQYHFFFFFKIEFRSIIGYEDNKTNTKFLKEIDSYTLHKNVPLSYLPKYSYKACYVSKIF